MVRRPVREGTDGKFGRGMVRMEGGVECGWVERWSGVGYEVVEGLCCARSEVGRKPFFRA